MDLMSLVATLSLDTKNFVQGINEAKGQVSGISSVSVAVGNLISQGFNSAVGAVKNFAGYVMDSGKTFESTMSQVQAISGASGEEMDALTQKAKEMGSTTKFSASEAGEAFTYMAMAGWKSGEMIDGITGIMNLAAASGENLATTSDIVTDALTAFGLSAQDAGHFSDVIAAASSNANTNVSMLGESFKYVAPLAGAMTYSAEDVATALGLMANAGIKGSQAGTSLRGMLTRLAKPTKESYAAMEQLGISITDTDGKVLPLNAVLEQMREKFAGLTETQKAEYAAMLAGQEGMSGLLAIVNASTADYDKLRTAIIDCDGATQTMADTMQNNLSGALTILKSGVEGLALTFYDGIKGTAKDAVEGLTEAVGKINEKVSAWLQSDATQQKLGAIAEKVQVVIDKLVNNLDPILDGVIGLFDMLVDGIGYAIEHFDEIASVISTVVTAFVGLKAAMAAIQFVSMISNIASLVASMNPVTLAIGAIVAALALLMTNWEKVREVGNAVWSAISGVWNKAGEFFNNVATNIYNALANVSPNIANIFKTAWSAVQAVWNTVGAYFNAVWETIKGIFSVVHSVLTGNFQEAWNGIKRIVDGWKGYFQSIWDGIKNVFSNVANTLIGFFTTAWNGIKNIWQTVTGWFSNVVTSVINAFTSIPSKIAQFFSDAWEKVKKAWGDVKSYFGEIPGKIYEVFTSLPKRFGEIGNDIVKGLWDGINEMTSWISKKISGFTDTVVSGFKNFFGIKSPSRVMRDQVGKYLGMGIGEGIMDEADFVQKAYDSLMPDVSAGKVGVSSGIGTAGGNNSYSITINVNGAKYENEQTLAQAISLELQNMMDRRKAVFA